MRFLPSTLVTLLLGIGITAGLFGFEYVPVPPAYAETLAWLSHFHMVVLHMPIGLLAAWVLLQIMQWFMPHHDIDSAITTMLFFTWVSALFAVFTGTFLDWFGKYSPELLDHHREAALLFTAFLTMAFTFRVLRKIEESSLWVVGYVICLLGASLVMLPTGHRGGTLTHGSGFLMDRAPDYVTSFLRHEDEVVEAAAPVVSVATPYFASTILPIFEEYCTRCHGIEKQKGELRLDSYAFMLEGGEHGTVIDADDPSNGSMYLGLIIELEDDRHMPPDGKPQLEAEELEVLKSWIMAGAKETTN